MDNLNLKFSSLEKSVYLLSSGKKNNSSSKKKNFDIENHDNNFKNYDDKEIENIMRKPP